MPVPSRRARRPPAALEALRRRYFGRFGPTPRPERWVFVVGCYNSGTTLLHTLLAEHPAVGKLPREGQFLTDQLAIPRELGIPRLWALEPQLFRLTEADGHDIDAARIKRQWGGRYDDHRRPYLAEHSPTNAGRTRWLQQHFRPASFVGIVRDGNAVVAGMRRKAGHSVADGARQWAESNRIMLDDFEHLDHAIVVRYEELAARPDEVVGEVLDFLGLPPRPDAIGDRPITVHGERSPIRDMNERSSAELTDADRLEIRRVAGAMLDRLGYS